MTEQETNFRPPSMAKISLKYGIFVGLALIVLNLLPFMRSGGWMPLLIILLVMVLGIWFAHNEYKNMNQGILKYGRAVGIGALVSTVIGVFQMITLIVVLNFFFKGDFVTQMQRELEKQNTGQLTEEQIAQAINVTMIAIPIFWLFTVVFLGVILTLVIAAFTQRRPQQSL